jgi:ActR/RegA family two-component response regulator
MELPESLIIIDDDPDLLKTIGRFAEKAGIKKVLLLSKSSDLNDNKIENYHVALVDLFLLNEKGSDVIKKLQKQSKNMSILAMTGAIERADVIKDAHNSGAISCLFKPVSYNYFLNMIYLAESMRIKKITYLNRTGFLYKITKKFKRKLFRFINSFFS